MKKYLLILIIVFFILIFAWWSFGVVFALPSFEVYPLGGHSYPSVDDVSVEKALDIATITATITDVSGVYSAFAIIKDSIGIEKEPEPLVSIGGGVYTASIDISNDIEYPVGIYTVDISVTDNLANNGVYTNVGGFSVQEPEICVDSNGATICVAISIIENSDTMTDFTVEPNSVDAGTEVVLTALLSGVDGQTVTFTDETASVEIGTITIVSGVATISYTPMSVDGLHNLKASYAGDATHQPSYKTTTLTVSNSDRCQGAQGAIICVDISTYMPWLTGWSHRKKITIQNDYVDNDLTDFPVYIKISAGTQESTDLASALSSGNDIRFTDSGGINVLPHEKESWSGGGDSAVTADFWVKVPMVEDKNSTATDIYIYYGKSDATDGQDVANVWDENYKGTWHMKDLTTSSIGDSTGPYNGTKIATNEPIEANGKIAKAQSFDGSNDRIYTPAMSSFTNYINPITLETWLYIPSDFTWINGSIAYMPTTSSYGMGIYRSATANTIIFTARIGPVSSYGVQSYVIQRDAWYHLLFVGNGTTFDAYVNGVKINASAKSYGVYPGANLSGILRMGYSNIYGGNGGGYLKGFIDETRISSTTRSADWIKFEYRNMAEADNELTWDIQEEK